VLYSSLETRQMMMMMMMMTVMIQLLMCVSSFVPAALLSLK